MEDFIMKSLKILAVTVLFSTLFSGIASAGTETTYVQNVTGGTVVSSAHADQKNFPSSKGWANYRVCGKTEPIQFSRATVARMKVAINNPTSQKSAVAAVCNQQAGKINSLASACSRVKVAPGPIGQMMLGLTVNNNITVKPPVVNVNAQTHNYAAKKTALDYMIRGAEVPVDFVADPYLNRKSNENIAKTNMLGGWGSSVIGGAIANKTATKVAKINGRYAVKANQAIRPDVTKIRLNNSSYSDSVAIAQQEQAQAQAQDQIATGGSAVAQAIDNSCTQNATTVGADNATGQGCGNN